MLQTINRANLSQSTNRANPTSPIHCSLPEVEKSPNECTSHTGLVVHLCTYIKENHNEEILTPVTENTTNNRL